MRFPKQFKHWCRRLNLYPQSSDRQFGYYYLKGRGRYWRISDSGLFQMSCPYSDFDRWVNSQVTSYPLSSITHFSQFAALVQRMQTQ